MPRHDAYPVQQLRETYADAVMMQQESLQCDVLVVGGGVAGIAAAVGAARTGAQVVLMEKYGFLGGMATAGMVSTVCGAFLRRTDGMAQFVANGFVKEFVESLLTLEKRGPLPLPGGLHIVPYAPWHMVQLADAYINKYPVRLLLHTTVQSVEKKGGAVVGVDCQSWSSQLSVKPVCVVDCTGEAVLIAQAGGARAQESGQSPSVLFRIEGLQADSQGARIALLRSIIHAAEEGIINADCANISFVPGHAAGKDLLLSIPMSSQEWSVSHVTELELHGRRLIEDIRRFLAVESYIGDADLPQTAVQIGIRTGSLAEGKARLTEKQVLRCTKNDQGVARGCWPIEIWNQGRKPEVTYLAENDYYDIPAGCLIAKSLDNVFMGGRCISAEERAIASVRVIGTSLGTGYGAGTLAGFQALGKELREAISFMQEHQK